MHETRDAWHDECIDPVLGREIWRLDDPQTDAALRRRLDAHVAHCAACRLERSLLETVADGLRGGRLQLRYSRRRELGRRLALAAPAAALAAGLALVFLPAPRPDADRFVMRTRHEGPAIVRPVADEVVPGRRPELRWTELPSATAYRISIEGVDDPYTLQARTEKARFRIPPDRPLPGGARFRIYVEPVPAYLAPPGGLRGSFRTGGFLDFVAYRLRTAPWWTLALLAAGLLGGVFLLSPRRGRGSAAGPG